MKKNINKYKIIINQYMYITHTSLMHPKRAYERALQEGWRPGAYE